jgi:hypothetical protein
MVASGDEADGDVPKGKVLSLSLAFLSFSMCV